MSFGLAACTKMFSTWDFRSAGAFPTFLLTGLASLPAWQFAAGYAQLHGFALPHGAETARRCVKHSLLERPGPKGFSPLQAQGLFGSRMGRFSTFCVSKVEKVSLNKHWSMQESFQEHSILDTSPNRSMGIFGMRGRPDRRA